MRKRSVSLRPCRGGSLEGILTVHRCVSVGSSRYSFVRDGHRNSSQVIRRFLVLALVIAYFGRATAQEGTDQLKTNSDKAQQVFDNSIAKPEAQVPKEKLPVYPGGEAALQAFLVKETKYPEEAREQGITSAVGCRGSARRSTRGWMEARHSERQAGACDLHAADRLRHGSEGRGEDPEEGGEARSERELMNAVGSQNRR
jgi:hypothetical protein